jgi:hypothetical protein
MKIATELVRCDAADAARKILDAFLLLERQQAAIEELVYKLGYLPEAHAILEKHGLR